MIVSPFKYSQWGEDVFLYKYIKGNKLGGKVPKVFIDIGASNGVSNSNSRYFVHLDWEVHLYEPDPTNFALLCQNTSNINKDACRVYAYNVAIGNRNARLKFKSEGGLSRLDPKGDVEVECLRVWDIISEGEEVGILDIDTEGNEENILVQFFTMGIKPCFLIIEHQQDGPKMQKQEKLLDPEYKRIRRKGVNDIWVLKSL